MKQKSLFSGNIEYEAFEKKFERKKTSDDCYTPASVMEAINDWVANEYGLDKANFVRPFFPDTEYTEYPYKQTDVVVDNPPFSILSKIIRFYSDEKIKFFLFGPHLTLFASVATKNASFLPVGVTITYTNGASINTSFVTNLEPSEIIARSCPELYRAIKTANDKELAQIKKQLPIYSYPKNILSTQFFHRMSRLGVLFSVRRSQSAVIDKLDMQRDYGKAIFGKGLLVSDGVRAEREAAEREAAEREAAEREAAEREAAEREAAITWQFSEREKEYIRYLNKND